MQRKTATRRGVLTVAGGALVALAGCADSGEEGDGETEEGGLGTETDGMETETDGLATETEAMATEEMTEEDA
jgi:hypothetical protein